MTLHTNFRQYRHIFNCLVDEEYVAENKKVAVAMLRLLKEKAPIFFEDFIETEPNKWKIPGEHRNLNVNAGIGNAEKRKLGIDVYEDDILV